jgi:hypothetical protein
MKKEYLKLVNEGLQRVAGIRTDNVTDEDLKRLPEIVQKYLRYTGVAGREKVISFRAACIGIIRGSEKAGWMNFRSEQYNFFDKPSRFFYIVAKMLGIPAKGLHSYKDETASMVIKLLGIFTITDARGVEMNKAETVTLFNDMCFLAPATLISDSIIWEEIDDLNVKATFTNKKLKISAILTFNEKGEMVNFISYDRYETVNSTTFRNLPWSTPVSEYGNFGPYRLASKADLIYHRPEGDFCYGNFIIKSIEYNIKQSGGKH